ncbi:uncharacterized protein I303_106703 [Kwoniella dejecticola CBS 10117]|uniref:Amino acid permease/ SLC12A domain-containing protein n=1 Tax=Kwoniella dejecticola CBS 10117 TaxID=1296121 RepID=A0A1A5ZTY0_9TREE|nr:uncharacterized protein I303_08655 [Kwoniella dejecticola CBS 10117]OBR81269.1 hypothetical protein I303_08655 [Kwoniella dejecticola CBS 10117]
MRHLQLIAISGAIGSSVFLSIGKPLTGGPLALLLGVSLWSTVIWGISNCLVEMCTLFPVEGGFIYYATRFLDPSMGFSLGWNYFICQVSLICGEFTSMNVLIAYWAPDLTPAVVIAVGLALLVAVQVFNVRIYGETEFWISILKIFMIFGAFLFTFIVMVGGNPKHDKYGFRFWKDPGPFAGVTGVDAAQNVWRAIQWAAYGIVGPDYISLVAGEVQHPRRVLPKAFNSTIYRILGFYVGGAFFAGLNAPANDPSLLGASGAAKSPYIINMNRLGIPYLPSILTAGLLISLFSSTSSMAFAASRTLYCMGLEGHAPKIVTRTNKHGLPYVCVLVVLALGCLSFMALGSGSATVLSWFINLTAATQMITWIAVAASYIRFRAGMKAQGLTNSFLPARGYFQPWSAWWALFWSPIALIFSGYYFFAPGTFAVADFLFTYMAVFIFVVLCIGWKVRNVIKFQESWFGIEATEMDFKTGIPELEEMTVQAEEDWQNNPQTKLDKVVNRIF